MCSGPKMPPSNTSTSTGKVNENSSVTGSRTSSLISIHVSLRRTFTRSLLHRVAGERKEDVLQRGKLDAKVRRRDVVLHERAGDVGQHGAFAAHLHAKAVPHDLVDVRHAGEELDVRRVGGEDDRQVLG